MAPFVDPPACSWTHDESELVDHVGSHAAKPEHRLEEWCRKCAVRGGLRIELPEEDVAIAVDDRFLEHTISVRAVAAW